jgi:hypothetical protein
LLQTVSVGVDSGFGDAKPNEGVVDKEGNTGVVVVPKVGAVDVDKDGNTGAAVEDPNEKLGAVVLDDSGCLAGSVVVEGVVVVPNVGVVDADKDGNTGAAVVDPNEKLGTFVLDGSAGLVGSVVVEGVVVVPNVSVDVDKDGNAGAAVEGPNEKLGAVVLAGSGCLAGSVGNGCPVETLAGLVFIFSSAVVSFSATVGAGAVVFVVPKATEGLDGAPKENSLLSVDLISEGAPNSNAVAGVLKVNDGCVSKEERFLDLLGVVVLVAAGVAANEKVVP